MVELKAGRVLRHDQANGLARRSSVGLATSTFPFVSHDFGPEVNNTAVKHLTLFGPSSRTFYYFDIALSLLHRLKAPVSPWKSACHL